MKINKKILKIALIVYIALMVVVIFSSKTIYNLSLPRVSVASPQSGRLVKGLDTFGFTEFADTFTAFAEVYGQIEEMLVQVGDYVKQGDPIARYRITNPEEEAFILRSLNDGIVISLNKENGAFTNPGERVATMGVASNQFYVNISCMPEVGSFIEQGDTAELSITGIGRVTATVSQMFLGYDGRLNIRLDFEADIRQGQYARVSIQKQTQVYNVIVPNEAIVREGMKNYVWIVQSRQGALGTEYFTVKVRVIIADFDDFNTAIARGLDMVFPAVPVVVSKDKDLTVNGRVRRME
jgi:multidrug efflux pump subunit AcrA (membrane-fusion protein)